MLSFPDSVSFLKRTSLCFYHQLGGHGKLFYIHTENRSTYISSTFCGHQKVFSLLYNTWLETMDGFHYFPNIYCSLRSRCKRYPVSTFARILKLWWEKLFRGISAKDIFNCIISNFWWYGLSNISNFPKPYGFMPRAISFWSFKNVKIVCSTNTMFVVKFIKLRIFCFRKIVSQR